MAKTESVVGQDRAALEAFVASGDTSVPGVETSDLNDGDILARTREEVNPNGQFRFIYIPDDGTDNIVSDWVGQDHKKKLVPQWVDGVKNAIVGRAQEGLRVAKERSLEERAKRIRAEQMGDINAKEEVDTTPTTRAVPVRVSNTRGTDTFDIEPDQYIRVQMEQARERLDAAERTQSEIIREVLAARKAVAKWQALSDALNEKPPKEGVDSQVSLKVLEA